MESKEEIARILHETYETCAKAVGWKTQKKCRVAFKDLPDDNRLVMLKMAELIQKMIKEELDSQLKSLRQHRKITLKRYDDSFGYDIEEDYFRI